MQKGERIIISVNPNFNSTGRVIFMRCKVCGANLPVESLFCYACGWRMQNSNGKNVAKKRKINKTQPKSQEHIDVGSVESFNDSKTASLYLSD